MQQTESHGDNQQVRETEWAWLSGFFDAEGSISLSVTYDKGNRDKPYYNKKVSLVNKSWHPIRKAESILARAGARPGIYEEKNGLYHRLMLNASAKVKSALDGMEKYLAGKKHLARLMLRYIEDTDPHTAKLIRDGGVNSKLNYAIADQEALAWLAGFIDGDGFIGCGSDVVDKKKITCPRIVITQKCQINVDRCLSILERCGISSSTSVIRNPRSTYSTITVSRTGCCEKLCNLLLPHLVEKKPNAELLLDFLKRKGSRSSLTTRGAPKKGEDIVDSAITE